ncbi:hypothetical protein [Flavobacterium faecale]|uniref:hypothetical protein n=1 Tax=Flavobacterium faecale TaxID=1355330 RepID=UPI003AB0D78D
MKKLNAVWSLGLGLLLCISCSSDDKDPNVIFNTMSANKTDVYIEEPIAITLEGTGFTETNLTSTNSKIKITKISNTSYEVSSTEATTGKIYAELKNKSNSQSKNINLSFYKHGIIDFKTVEGITVNSDTSDKIIKLLGEPEVKTDLTASTPAEKWEYTSKGVNFIVIKSTKLVTIANVNSSNFYTFLSDGITKLTYTKYPYEIGNGWKIDLSTTTMTNVINKLGTDYIKSSSTTNMLRNYKFSFDNQKVYFYFYADTEDDYSGKTIRSVLID